MNKEWDDALSGINDEHIHEAARQKYRFPWLRSIAAVLAVTICWGALGHEFQDAPIPTDPILQATTSTPTDSGNDGIVITSPSEPVNPGPTTDTSTIPPTDSTAPPAGPVLVPLSGLAAAPVYPEKATYADSLWDIYTGLNSFFDASIQEFLSGEGNRAYSPLNVYMALSMLAETCDGNSRRQILDLLGASTIEELRSQTGDIWNAHFENSMRDKLLLSNSLWLDNKYLFDPNTVQTLADDYYASVYAGDLGSDEMNQALRRWLDLQTDGQLMDHNQNFELHPNSVFALASTIYYKANWSESFNKDRTADGIFHSTQGDVTVPFMKSSIGASYYWGTDYTAVSLHLTDSGDLWLILPDEGKTTDDLLESGEFLSTVLPTEMIENSSYPLVHLSMPKFDISANSDLIEGMKNLGVTDIFSDDTADMSNLTDGPLYVDKIDHTVRVAVDEDGILGTAQTIVDVPNYGMPPDDEVDFVLDRPFLFMITSWKHYPLFAGVVEQP